MSESILAIWVGAVAAILAAVIGAILGARYAKNLREEDSDADVERRVRTLENVLADLKVKVETMWQFQIRRGITEAINSGLATKNSPLKFDEDALRYLEPLKTPLIALWKAQPPTMSDSEFLLLIEKTYSSDIVNNICIPCKLSHAACLLMAFAVAKQQNPIDFNI